MQPSVRSDSSPVMNGGSSDPLSEANHILNHNIKHPPVRPTPPVLPGDLVPEEGMAGDANRLGIAEAGWRKPAKVARRSGKGKDPVVAYDSGDVSPGPLALVPALMEVTPAAQSSADRAMVEAGSLALKRCRSLSPERLAEEVESPGQEVDELPMPVSSVGRKDDGQVLLLLPAPPSSEGEVSARIPCMDSSFSDQSRDGGKTAAGGATVKDVLWGDKGSGVGGTGDGVDRRKSQSGRKLPPNWVVSKEVGQGGPIRRAKARRPAEEGRAAVMGKGKAALSMQKPSGRGSGGAAGGRASGKSGGRAKSKSLPAEQSSSPVGGRRGGVGKGKALVGPRGGGGSPGNSVKGDCLGIGPGAGGGGGGVRRLRFSGSPSSPDLSNSPVRSPAVAAKSLLPGNSRSGGNLQEGGGSSSLEHGELVRRVKRAVLAGGEEKKGGLEAKGSPGTEEGAGEGG